MRRARSIFPAARKRPAPRAAPEDRVSLSREAVELLRGEHQVAVNAAVIKRLGEMDSSVLDILA